MTCVGQSARDARRVVRDGVRAPRSVILGRQVDITITLTFTFRLEGDPLQPSSRKASHKAVQNSLAVIKVVGIGGGGVNAVNRMIEVGLKWV